MCENSHFPILLIQGKLPGSGALCRLSTPSYRPGVSIVGLKKRGEGGSVLPPPFFCVCVCVCVCVCGGGGDFETA